MSNPIPSLITDLSIIWGAIVGCYAFTAISLIGVTRWMANRTTSLQERQEERQDEFEKGFDDFEEHFTEFKLDMVQRLVRIETLANRSIDTSQSLESIERMLSQVLSDKK